MPKCHLTLYLTSITQPEFLQMTIPLKFMHVYDMIVLASVIYISHHHTISYVHSWYHLHMFFLILLFGSVLKCFPLTRWAQPSRHLVRRLHPWPSACRMLPNVWLHLPVCRNLRCAANGGRPKIQTRPSIRIDITNNITPHNMAFMFTTQLVNVDQCWFALFGSSWYHMSSVHMLFHVMFTFPKFALVLDSEMFWFWFHE